MHWIQDEQSVEYHVIQWRNSAFHNHDKQPKRKMLGGVSFDGGGVGKSAGLQQTGVQNAQPSFARVADENLFGRGILEGGAYRDGKIGNSSREAAGTRTIAGAQSGSRDKLVVSNSVAPEAGKNALEADDIQGMTAVCQSASIEECFDTVKSENMGPSVSKEKRNRPFFRQYMQKFGNGIRTFLRGMEQKAGKENTRKQPKKEKAGTRAITKEELAQIQQDRTYLLDSYNKNGERSTLGR